MKFINLTIEDLKTDYKGRHGFVFQGSSDYNPKNCEVISHMVKNRGFTEFLPEFFVEFNPQTVAFVYPEGISFDAPAFYTEVSRFFLMGKFQIDLLGSFLQSN